MIIARFSDFSKMPQPHFQPVQLSELIQDVAKLHQAQLEKANIAFQFELAENLQPIAADPDLLHRAVSNLVLNAIEAMPQGGTLTLRTRYETNSASIEISDTGQGLSQEDCSRLFTPYYTSKAQGTGLGLAIVQSIVSDHGGRISVRSQQGRGTTFIIDLPPNRDKLPTAQGTHV
jgi:signal transduction histidine kinase